jgi:GntR family transcriptional regulator/MocR family aminotransferase
MNPFTIELMKGGPNPLYEQIYSYIAGEIMGGRLRENEKLPSKKALAAHLGISQNTVETAYSMLSQEGYVTAKPKSGFYVNRLDNMTAPTAPPVLAEQEASPGAVDYDFGTNAVDIPSFPYSTWAKLERETLYAGASLLTYGDPRGDFELREAIAKYLHEFRAVMCTPDQIVIGAGFEYLLMVLEQLLSEDTVFAVEDPVIRKHQKSSQTAAGHRPYSPGRQRAAPDLLQESGASAVYITPSCQFPPASSCPSAAGWSRSAGRRGSPALSY